MADPHNALYHSGPERRRYPRYAVKGRTVPVIFTWEINGRRGTGRGVVRDMSQGGLCMLTTDRPPVGARLVVALENVETSEPLTASVAYMRRARWFFFGPRVIGLRFSEVCPYDVFTAAFGWRRAWAGGVAGQR